MAKKRASTIIVDVGAHSVRVGLAGSEAPSL